jgi:DNA repair photolyase
MRQAALFDELADSAPRRTLPVLGEQTDIRYYETAARRVLNGPETTGMGFWSVNPYVGCAFGCAYCYARYPHRYMVERTAADAALDDAQRADLAALPPWLAFERRIFVKRNAPEALARALARGALMNQGPSKEAPSIVIGTATDPYQPAERRFRVTRGVLEVLAGHRGLDVVIITKSPLVTRDIDLLSRIAGRSSVAVHVSLITLDRELARRLEPRAPTPEARLRAVARLSAAGVEVGVNVMPVLPGITDQPAALDELVRRVAESGARDVAACALRLRHEARKRYLPFVEEEFPELAERYRATYTRKHHAGDRYRAGLRRYVERLCRKYGIRQHVYDDGEPDAPAADPGPEQLALAL